METTRVQTRTSKQHNTTAIIEEQLEPVAGSMMIPYGIVDDNHTHLLNNDGSRGDRFRPNGSHALQHVALPKACVPGSEHLCAEWVQPLTTWA